MCRSCHDSMGVLNLNQYIRHVEAETAWHFGANRL
jgi:hypothetical protein